MRDGGGEQAKPMVENRSISPSDYLAAERTFLAWIRTGLALMGFGFVVARFGLFLREIAITTHTHSPETTGVSLWIGITLLLIGVSVNVAASLRHFGLIGKLSRGEPITRPSAAAVAVALTLAALGLALAVYLVLMR
jgi:putative membrane protein